MLSDDYAELCETDYNPAAHPGACYMWFGNLTTLTSALQIKQQMLGL